MSYIPPPGYVQPVMQPGMVYQQPVMQPGVVYPPGYVQPVVGVPPPMYGPGYYNYHAGMQFAREINKGLNDLF